jgi:ribosomal protein S18 acetylase RimI-like enzyme
VELISKIRMATADDAPTVAEVLIESRRAFLPFAPLIHADADVRRWVRDCLVPQGQVRVWEETGCIAGVLATSVIDGTAWIEQLYVRPGWTSRGIGSELLAQAHTHAHKQAQRAIHLYTFQQNLGARRFYERHGYRPIAFSDGSRNEERCPDVLYQRLL